jgi:phosphoglucomutase
VQSSRSWEETSEELLNELPKISKDQEVLDNALRFLQTWIEDPLYETQKSAILSHIQARQYALLLDSFYQFVPFGTGGRRGRVGYGPNRINRITVSLSVQGHCNFLKQAFSSVDRAPIVVAFDTRIFRDISHTYDFLGSQHQLLGLTSRALAYAACEIYAGNGFVVYITDPKSDRAYLSTPELSFQIRYLKAYGGINVSASHNHPDDNGFKFYNREGAQDVPPTDEILTSFMKDIAQVNRLPFDSAVEQGYIRTLPGRSHEAYISTNLKLRTKETVPSIPVVYTPLSGTGDTTVGDVLRSAGYDVELYAPQANYDGTFASVPLRLPNPEVPEAARPALHLAQEKGACLVLSTDPDADRLGAYARAANGEWRYLTGNDIASIIAYYLTLDKDYGPQRSGLIIKTLVTTRTLENIAERSNCKIIPDLLVGFKYIAHVLDSLERTGRYNEITATAKDLVIAAEESHGVLLTPEIRDKDSAGGALILCELTSQLCAENKTLPEYLDRLLIECGNYASSTRSIVMRGIQGTEALKTMMQSLRSEPFKRIGDFAVSVVVDYLSAEQFGPLRSETDRLSRNLMLFRMYGVQVVIRPSGTEPKVKIYSDIEGRKLVSANDRRAAEGMARYITDLVFDLCLDRIGVRLSPSAKQLPDHVDLDLRKDFDENFRRDLLDAAEELSRLDDQEKLQWLRQRLSRYGAGADPIETAGHAVAHLCNSLLADAPSPQVRKALLSLHSLLTPGEDRGD